MGAPELVAVSIGVLAVITGVVVWIVTTQDGNGG